MNLWPRLITLSPPRPWLRPVPDCFWSTSRRGSIDPLVWPARFRLCRIGSGRRAGRWRWRNARCGLFPSISSPPIPDRAARHCSRAPPTLVAGAESACKAVRGFPRERPAHGSTARKESHPDYKYPRGHRPEPRLFATVRAPCKGESPPRQRWLSTLGFYRQGAPSLGPSAPSALCG